MNHTRLIHNLFLGIILLLAFALRVAGLADSNIWWDEGWSVSLARRPVADILEVAAHDNHPPLHNLILRGWWLLVGDGEYVMRFPSVLFGLVWLTLIYRLGRTLGGWRVGALAALLLALSRFAVTWAQSARMYTWAALLTTGMLWAALELWRSESRRAWLAYTLCLAGGLLSLYLTIAAPLTANLVFPFIWRRRGYPRRMLVQWLTAHLVALVLFLPWMLRNITTATTWAIVEPITLWEYLRLYATMLVVGVPLNLDAYLPLTLLVCGIGLGGLFILWHARKTLHQSAGLALLSLGLVVQAVTVYAICFGVIPGFARPLEPRYLVLLAGNFYILLAWGMERMANERISESANQRISKSVNQRIGESAKRRISESANQQISKSANQHVPLSPSPSLPLSPSPSPLLPFSLPRLPSTVYRLPSTVYRLPSTLVIFAALVGLWTFYPGRARRDDYVSVAATLRAHVHPNDVVVLYVDRDWPLFEAQYAGPRHNLAYGAPLDAASAAARLAPIWEAAEGLWLVTTPEAQQTDPTQAVPAWLAERAARWGIFVAGEVQLTFYARTPERAARFNALAPDFAPPANLRADIGGGQLRGATVPLPRYATGDTLRLVLYWDRLPREDITIALSGVNKTFSGTLPDTAPARQVILIPLTPDLPGGVYRLWLHAGDAPSLEVGRFTLVSKAAGTATSIEQITHPLNLRLGENIWLLGYDLPSASVHPGETLELTLYWQAAAPITSRYKVFTHLLGEVYNAATGNFLWGQQDNEPGNGQALTTLWTPGAVIADPYRIPVDAAAPPGVYTLEIGMYGLVDITRLPVFTANGSPQGDAIYLTKVTVQTN